MLTNSQIQLAVAFTKCQNFHLKSKVAFYDIIVTSKLDILLKKDNEVVFMQTHKGIFRVKVGRSLDNKTCEIINYIITLYDGVLNTIVKRGKNYYWFDKSKSTITYYPIYCNQNSIAIVPIINKEVYLNSFINCRKNISKQSN